MNILKLKEKVMRKILGILAVAMGACLGGCIPERTVWSPDGSRVAVLGDDGLHICDADGRKMSGLLVPECSVVQWFPDGKKVVVVRKETLKTWKEIHALLPNLADHRDTVRKELLGYEGKAEEQTAKIAEATKLRPDEVIAALIELRDTEGAALEGALWERWPKLKDLEYEVSVGEVCALSDKGATEEKRLIVITQTLGAIMDMRVSPTGKAVVFEVTPQSENGNGKEQAVTLYAEATDGSTTEDVILGRTAWFPDWSTDGRYLVYIKPLGEFTGKDEAHLGMLVRREVVNEHGALWTTQSLPAEEQLVGLLYQGESRVRVLKDGRIFFVATDVNLPTTVADIDAKPTLFSIQPGKQATVTRVIPRSAEVGDLVQFFEVSTDLTRVSIPFEDGRVSVLDLGTGKAEMVQGAEDTDKNNGWKLQSVPMWRSATELTFVRPTEGGKREVVLYSVVDKSVKVLSGGWAGEVKKDWLEKKDETGAGMNP